MLNSPNVSVPSPTISQKLKCCDDDGKVLREEERKTKNCAETTGIASGHLCDRTVYSPKEPRGRRATGRGPQLSSGISAERLERG